MEDPFWFSSNVTMEQDIGGGGRRRGYDIEGQEQEMMKWKSMMKIDDHHNHQNTTVNTTKKTKGKKGGRTLQRKPEKKNPKRGVGIAKLEETIKQKNSQLPEADRQVYHGYPTTPVDSVLPTTTTYDNQSHWIQFHHLPPFLHHQQQKHTSTVSSSSVDVHGADTNINDKGGYDQVIMNYGSAATNVNEGLYQLMNSSHNHQQPYVLHPPSKQQQQQHGNSTNYNGSGYNPSAGFGVHGDQHGNNNGAAAGFYSPKVVELSSTPKQQHYHFSPQQSDYISRNIQLQKNLNNGENIGGFTRYSKTGNKSADFLELGRNWNFNNVDIKKDSKAAGAGYSGLSNDQVELLPVHRKGKSSSSSSSILMEYEFLSSSMKGRDQYHHTSGGSKKNYSSNYSSSSSSSSSSCVMEESAASSSAVRKWSVSSSQSNNADHHGFLDLSLKLSSYH